MKIISVSTVKGIFQRATSGRDKYYSSLRQTSIRITERTSEIIHVNADKRLLPFRECGRSWSDTPISFPLEDR